MSDRTTPEESESPAASREPAADTALTWEPVGRFEPASVGLLGFDAGYVNFGTGSDNEPMAWFSPDGAEWQATRLAEQVLNCPGWGPEGDDFVPDADVAGGATNGEQVLLVGAEHLTDPASCASEVPSTIQAVTWVSDDGVTWERSAPFGSDASNARAATPWAMRDGWRVVVEEPVRGALSVWQSDDGLTWERVASVGPTVALNNYAAAAPDGTSLLSVALERTAPAADGRIPWTLLSSTDGRIWQEIRDAGGCESGTGPILPPARQVPGWTLFGVDIVCTSDDLEEWTTATWISYGSNHGTHTRHGRIVATITCPPATREGPPHSIDCLNTQLRTTQYLSRDGRTWEVLDPSVSIWRVADGPSGVIGIGSSGESPGDGPNVWRLAEGVAASSPRQDSRVGWLDPELFLLSGFRTQPGSGQVIDPDRCVPRRADLPENATYGVECSIADGPAEQVGAYLFATAEDAGAAYVARLAEYGVELGAAAGADGCGAEGTELPGDEDSVPRSGTFLNEFGYANLRVLFPSDNVYAGVLGRTADCNELWRWARLPPELGATPNPVNVWSPPPAVN